MLGQIQVRKEIADRLKQKRIEAGYVEAKDFCDQHNLPLQDYVAYEEAAMPLSASKALQYCKLLHTSLHWLMLGERLSRFYEKKSY